MKLKYYLRGLGVGIILTVILMMIGFSGQKNSISDEEVIERARRLGMVMEEEQVSGLKDAKKQNSDQNAAKVDDKTKGTDEQAAANGQNAGADVQGENTDAGSQEGNTGQEAGTDGSGTDGQAPADGQDAGAASSGAENNQPEYVPIEIVGGEYSDKISQKLFVAELIDDPEAFNRYLVESGIDIKILVGVHNIPKGATPEEIAQILCEKPEEVQ